jgi:hypothetical protein
MLRVGGEVSRKAGILKNKVLDARVEGLPRGFPGGQCLANDFRLGNPTLGSGAADHLKHPLRKFNGHRFH